MSKTLTEIAESVIRKFRITAFDGKYKEAA
jgi:hypothetical protein